MTTREQRKNDHIKYALDLHSSAESAGFSDVHIMPNCLPEIDSNTVDLTTDIGAIKLRQPLIINAITGGTPLAGTINGELALVARATGCAMAVGSQFGTVHAGGDDSSFRIVRQNNPDGVVLANVSAKATVKEALKAVDMLEAQGLQIHLNPAQELAMAEGDRDFTGYLKNIEKIVQTSSVPVIIKETSCGIAYAQARALLAVGVNVIDVGGLGGTNFPLIEQQRQGIKLRNELAQWGLPTVLSLLEVKRAMGNSGTIIAAGGLRTGLECFKSLALGSQACAMAGNILSILQTQGSDALIKYLNSVLLSIRNYLVLTNCLRIKDALRIPLYFTGMTKDALESLGYDLIKLGRGR